MKYVRMIPLLVLLTLGATLARAAAPEQLPPRILAAMRQQGLPPAAVSIVVRDAANGTLMLDMNPTTPRTPASVMKLLPTYAALDILGPAYTWKTRAWTDGTLSRGVLTGNLYLQGGGDPLMNIERWWRFVTDLRQTGLRRIDGNIVIDNSRFAPNAETPGDFDNRPWRTYNVLPDALLVNLQSAEFLIRPSVSGRGIEVEVDPRPDNLVIENRAQLVTGRCRGRARGVAITTPRSDPNRIVVTGKLSSSCGPQIARRVIMGAPEFAFGTFATLWKQQGGELTGGMARGITPKTAKLLVKQDSLTMAEIVRVTNKFSSNVMARSLVLTLAAENSEAPATPEVGGKVIGEWLQRQGLAFSELVIGNGSGLSREARISADSLARLLVAAWTGRYAPEYLASLPLGGLDGTLKRRFAGLAEANRVRMKTGTLNGTSSLAGYVTAADGRTYSTVIIVNHPGVQNGPGEAVQTAVVRWVLALDARPASVVAAPARTGA
jgi:D-alanyl-D-alanine carboxypeptidase/D-alanyl-D-alanine-endopeptidase (penicillin-binding protein 4)